MQRRLTSLIAALACCACACSPAQPGRDASRAPDASSGSAPSPDSSSTGSASSAEDPTLREEPTRFTISSSGDILLHLSVNHYARSQGTYDYTPLFAGIRPWIESSDLALCSLEVPIVPDGEQPSNYPMMGSPAQIATSLKSMGWDGCSLATNHTMDRGWGGIVSTVNHFEAAGLGFAGTSRTEEESRKIQYYTVHSGKRDVKIAHLAATTLTNGMPLPRGAEWGWNVVGQFGRRSVDNLIADARRARSEGADVVVVSMHWGTEYVNEPTAEQQEIARQLAASGQVDLVFGNHSHVAEPVAKIDGGPGGAGMWVAWSMGNTISGQTVESHGYGVLAGLLTTATAEVPASGPVRVVSLDWTAITQDDRSYLLFPLNELVAGARPDGLRLSSREIAGRADALYPVMTTPEQTTPPTPQATLVESFRR